MRQTWNEGFEHAKQLQRRLTTGFSEIMDDRANNGCSLDLITILFDEMKGSKSRISDQMRDQISRLYSTFVTRVHRSPTTAPTHRLPLLVGALDLPVYKRNRLSAPTVSPNDGLHFHGILIVPPNSRLKGTVSDHFRLHFGLYGTDPGGIARIDVRPVVDDRAGVMNYVLKTVGNGRLSYDDAIVILPRSKSELTTSQSSQRLS